MTTIIDLLPEFLEHLEHERQLAPATLRGYTSDLLQVHAAAGGKPFSEIGIDDIRRFMRGLKADGLTVSTIHRKLHALSTFYRFEIAMGVVDTNVSLQAQQFGPKKKQRVLRKLLTVDEWRRFVETPAPRLRDHVAWNLLGWLGVRQSELRGIRVGDVQWGTVVIRGKGGHERRLPVPDNVKNHIDELMMGRGGDEYLLPGDGGGYWSRDSFYGAFYAHCERAGLSEDVTPHWLRHTVATHLSQTMTVFDLRAWLGHKSTRTTELYVHSSGRVLSEVMSRHPLGDRN
jgi:integrase/recombinase XerD